MKQENHTKRSPIRSVIALWLIVGSLDILSAIIDYFIATGKNPSGIFKYIASAILGNDAFSGGAGVVLLGLVLHYVVALIFTVFFVWLYTKTNSLPNNKFLCGFLYGAFIWAIMNLIVVPLSAAPAFPFHLVKAIKAMLILIFMIGFPLSFLTGRFIGNSTPATKTADNG